MVKVKLFSLLDVELTIEYLVKWIQSILVLGLLIILIVVGMYVISFDVLTISRSTSVWGQFGDFLGGTLNPIFGFLTLITLLLTITIQSKQLEVSSEELKNSRIELELTREELAKSALAQEESQKALNKQAEIALKSSELNSTIFLLDMYKIRRDAYKKNQRIGENLYENKGYLDAHTRCSNLESIIEVVYQDLIKARTK